ncbi:hypothetical protein GCM10010171_31970 [Actinokineospora fastidiosa]|uniref:Uncharacterized protein n=1 Tax=Actinokineospora fastidiosa TaxID=1816 RepID=A0A918GHD9_9PSEU|nr:hypothetical protein GCM10010171_31970 [Actinokineospora fastidiosa]
MLPSRLGVDGVHQERRPHERGHDPDPLVTLLAHSGRIALNSWHELSVRIGAVYALDRIVTNAPADRDTIQFILCAYRPDWTVHRGGNG